MDEKQLFIISTAKDILLKEMESFSHGFVVEGDRTKRVAPAILERFNFWIGKVKEIVETMGH
jgi:hypothetical protein